jgi:hypothetical protein
MRHPVRFPLSRRAFLRAAWRVGATSLVAATGTVGILSQPPTTNATDQFLPTGSGLYGVAIDAATLLPVNGATIGVASAGIKVTSGRDGTYVLPLPPGTYDVAVAGPTYIGTSFLAQNVPRGYAGLNLNLIPRSPTLDQQELLYQRLVKQTEAPLVTPDVLQRLALQPADVGLPTAILVNYGTRSQPSFVSVSLEDYVKGVVPNEVPASWPTATLLAQAVAVRSYGVASQLTNGFVWPDTRSQLYNPSYRTETTDAAADATASQVMTVNGSVIFAFYFSRCNGTSTVNSENVITYVTDGNGNIIHNGNGQAICQSGGWNYVSYCRARSCTGHSPSTFSTCGVYGTGVGMCQWGAFYRGGMSYTDILNSYYTGVTITGATPPASPTATPLPTATPTPTPIPVPPAPLPLGPGLVTPGQSVTLLWSTSGPGVQYLGSLYLDGSLVRSWNTPQTSVSVGQLPIGAYTWGVEARGPSGVSTVKWTTLLVVTNVYKTELPWVASQ